MTASPPNAPLTGEQIADEWSNALQHIHEDDRVVLEFARTWADSYGVDYDEGPCAIEFKKDGASYWYLIDDVGWDIDDPRTALIVEALRELKAARATVVDYESAMDRANQRTNIACDQRDRAEAERDSLRAQLAASEQARHEAEQLAESRFMWSNQLAERIATWLESRSAAHSKTLASLPDDEHNREQRDEHGWAASYGSGWAHDIREGKWRP